MESDRKFDFRWQATMSVMKVVESVPQETGSPVSKARLERPGRKPSPSSTHAGSCQCNSSPCV